MIPHIHFAIVADTLPNCADTANVYIDGLNNSVVTESAGEHGPGATLCFWGTKLAQASVLGSSGYDLPSLSHADMQSLCICMYVS